MGGTKRLPRKTQGSVGSTGGPGGPQGDLVWCLRVAQQDPRRRPFLAGWGWGGPPVGPSSLPTVNEKVPISQVCGEDEVMRLTLETCILIGLAYTTSGMIKKWGFSDDRIALDCIGFALLQQK